MKKRKGVLYEFLISALCFFAVGCTNNYHSKFNVAALESIPDTINYSNLYDGHLQGITTDFSQNFFWSHTKQLVKTNLQGDVLKVVDVPFHHGDLTFYKGKLYVAVNFGKFNEEPGLADSWVYVYNSNDLKLLEKYPVPEVVHGAGGIEIHDDVVFIVGGLPGNGNYTQNFICQFNLNFNLQKVHELPGYTYKGIQTASYYNGLWYFACYGNAEGNYEPCVLIVQETAENKLQILQTIFTDMSYGIIGLSDHEFLYANKNIKFKTAKTKLSW